MSLSSIHPFESIGADMMLGYNYNSGSIEASYLGEALTLGGVSFSGSYYGPVDVVYGAGNDLYVSDSILHSVLKFDRSNTSVAGVTVVGK
ncbi:MAG: hypothetical protein H6767_04710 [Candidatus Peribacteria bacterium]|nr:MAG: hypothetical protein H6767_04710 [Candidatus Peribacteria bacterium]